MGSSFWHGVRMRRTSAAANPESSLRAVTLPAVWDDAAAAALAALAPGQGPCRLDSAAAVWIEPIERRAVASGMAVPLGERLREMLLRRRGAAAAPLWRGKAAELPGLDLPIVEPPGFVLNLAAFVEPGSGFGAKAFGAAAETAIVALALAAPGAARVRVCVADLAGMLAALGLGYDSDAARDQAVRAVTLLRTSVERAAGLLPAGLHVQAIT